MASTRLLSLCTDLVNQLGSDHPLIAFLRQVALTSPLPVAALRSQLFDVANRMGTSSSVVTLLRQMLVPSVTYPQLLSALTAASLAASTPGLSLALQEAANVVTTSTFVPSDLSNLLVQLQADNPPSVYQDQPAPGTTLATASGQPLGVLRDRSPNAGHYAAPTDALRPRYDIAQPALAGRVSYGLGNPSSSSVLVGPTVTAPGALTVAFDFRWRSFLSSSFQDLWILKTGASEQFTILAIKDGGYRRLSWRAKLGSGKAVGVDLPIDQARHDVYITFNGTGDPSSPSSYRCWIDGEEKVVQASGDFAGGAIASTIGGRWDGTNGSAFVGLEQTRAAAWAADHSARVNDVRGWLREVWPVGTVVGALGDSLFAGLANQINPISESAPAQVRNLLNAAGIRIDMRQCAIPNQTTATMLANGYLTGAAVLLILTSTNDIATASTLVNSGDVTTAINNTNAVIALHRAANPDIKIAVCTIPARADTGTIAAGGQGRIDSYNTQVRNGAFALTKTVDLASDSRFQNPANTAIYAGDFLHFNANGHLVMAQKLIAETPGWY